VLQSIEGAGLSGFRVRASYFEFRVQGFGFRVQGHLSLNYSLPVATLLEQIYPGEEEEEDEEDEGGGEGFKQRSEG